MNAFDTVRAGIYTEIQYNDAYCFKEMLSTKLVVGSVIEYVADSLAHDI